MGESITKLTRSIYEDQHIRYTNDKDAFQRLYDIHGNTPLPIPKKWFKGKWIAQ